MLLEGENVGKRFSGLVALENVNFQIKEKELVGLIGPNGAGKTTLFNVISGIYRPTSGKIRLNGEDITGLKPHKICKMGIARTFQTPQLFSHMTVLENVVIGRHTRIRESFWSTIVRSRNLIREEKKAYQKAEEILDLVGLADKKLKPANSLAYGEARLLEIARALASEPKLLLLDEPTAGMNPSETKRVMDLIKKLCQSGLTIILVEHDMRAVMSYSDIVTVLDHGKKIAEGTPEEIQSNEQVISAYLGKRRGRERARG